MVPSQLAPNLQGYIFLACEETLGDFGQDLDCNTAPLGGECGSGQFADCDGNAHGVEFFNTD